MGWLRGVVAIAEKDLIAEIRTKELFSAMFVFALLTVVIFNFAFGPGQEEVTAVAPGILWVAFAFAGTLGLNRTFALEKERDCLQGLRLCPVDGTVIFGGKLVGSLLFMGVVEAVLLPLFALFYGVALGPVLPQLLLVLFLGTLGFAAVGTLFAAISTSTRTREVLLPILLFPIVVPVIIAAVKATGRILQGKAMGDYGGWLHLLLAFDIIFVAASALAFEYALEE